MAIGDILRPRIAKDKASDIFTRRYVAYLLLWLIVLIIIIALAEMIFGINWTDAAAEDKSKRLLALLNVVFGPVVTLFSSVVGFYFGAKTAQEGTGGGG